MTSQLVKMAPPDGAPPGSPATSRGNVVCVSIRSTHKQLVRLRFQVNLLVSAGLGRAEK